MTDDTRTLRVLPDLQVSTSRRLVRTGLALAGLLVVVPLVAVLPGVDRLFAGLTVSPWAVLLAVVTLLVAGALVRAAPTVERAVAESLDGPDAVVANVAAAAKLLVGFVAVVIASRGLAPLSRPRSAPSTSAGCTTSRSSWSARSSSGRSSTGCTAAGSP